MRPALLWGIVQWVVVTCDQCNLPWTCRYKPAQYITACKADRCIRMLRQHSTYNMAIKIHYTQIHTTLWLVYCTFAICSKKCKIQTASHQQTSSKHASCPPCLAHLPWGWNCKSWRWNGKAIFLHMAGLIVSDIRCIILFQCNFKIYTTFELTQ